jgi:hypothetical protein
MKTSVTSLSVKLSLNVLLFGFALLLTGYTVQAQPGKNDYLSLHTQARGSTTPAFGAAIFPLLDPLKVKVLVRNPRKESLSFLIRNDRQEVIYRKELGRPETLNTDFYLSDIADGEYIMEVAAQSARYAKPIRIETKVARVAQQVR